jgi:rhamnose utilization protein RhaD (predicted bifunctional aldolase and dehydrogenase)
MTLKANNKLNQLCFEMGKNPFLVQGAGGNVSIKEKDILWIKASGTSLSNAMKQNIFVPVKLDLMRKEFKNDNFNFTPSSIDASGLRPSIETLLHGLMNHKIVIHLHMISALRYLIKVESQKELADIIGDKFSWGYVPYCKPGENLAKAVSLLLKKKQDLDVVFLGNHGIVIGADSIENASNKVNLVDSILGKEQLINHDYISNISVNIPVSNKNFDWCSDQKLHNLAKNNELLQLINTSWALFPDHVVFLGPKPLVLENLNRLKFFDDNELSKECFIFIKDIGVLQNCNATNAQIEQLLCYFDVISNIDPNSHLQTLSEKEISELLNWDAEVYRQALSKNTSP